MLQHETRHLQHDTDCALLERWSCDIPLLLYRLSFFFLLEGDWTSSSYKQLVRAGAPGKLRSLLHEAAHGVGPLLAGASHRCVGGEPDVVQRRGEGGAVNVLLRLQAREVGVPRRHQIQLQPIRCLHDGHVGSAGQGLGLEKALEVRNEVIRRSALEARLQGVGQGACELGAGDGPHQLQLDHLVTVHGGNCGAHLLHTAFAIRKEAGALEAGHLLPCRRLFDIHR
mmetsp:Transcript_6702/g.19275  ORF Transcript_6702/g.19275 Transcript_6702/m.19275 type:complete len:226 (+) Transcript_6702:569-1246(+)